MVPKWYQWYSSTGIAMVEYGQVLNIDIAILEYSSTMVLEYLVLVHCKWYYQFGSRVRVQLARIVVEIRAADIAVELEAQL